MPNNLVLAHLNIINSMSTFRYCFDIESILFISADSWNTEQLDCSHNSRKN